MSQSARGCLARPFGAAGAEPASSWRTPAAPRSGARKLAASVRGSSAGQPHPASPQSTCSSDPSRCRSRSSSSARSRSAWHPRAPPGPMHSASARYRTRPRPGLQPRSPQPRRGTQRSPPGSGAQIRGGASEANSLAALIIAIEGDTCVTPPRVQWVSPPVITAGDAFAPTAARARRGYRDNPNFGTRTASSSAADEWPPSRARLIT